MKDYDNELKTRGQLSTIDEKIAEARNRRKKVRFCRLFVMKFRNSFI